LISVWPNISLTTTPSCSRQYANTASPTASPALIIGLQLQAVLLARPREGLHHGLQRGREQEGVRDAVLLQQLKAISGLKRPLQPTMVRPK
jgi:hypothetical protein